MRKFFMIFSYCVFMLSMYYNQALSLDNQKLQLNLKSFNTLTSSVWISETWDKTSPSAESNNSFFKKVFIIHIPWSDFQIKLKKPWNQYNNVEFSYYPSKNELSALAIGCIYNMYDECFEDNNSIVHIEYVKYYQQSESSEFQKTTTSSFTIQLTPDDKMIYNGATYIRLPFDQFDDYYEKYIALGPDGAGASTPATATVSQGSVVPPKPGDKPVASARPATNDNAFKYFEEAEQKCIKNPNTIKNLSSDPLQRYANLSEEEKKCMREVTWNREMRAMEELREELRKKRLAPPPPKTER